MDISVIGGDLRIIRLTEMYSKEKWVENIYTYGLEKYLKNNIEEDGEIDKGKIKICKTLGEAINNSEVIISGMPFTKDDISVNAPFSSDKIAINELFELLEGKTFIAGGVPKNLSENKKINIIDLLKSEKLTILNAIPTVEGTIKIAIEEREETIHESNILICGYGRIGKILCDRFKSLGANIYCTARKEADLAWIREKRYIPLEYEELTKYSTKFDIVINTVPTLVVDRKELDSFRKDVLLIDLASAPGGINKEYAESIGLKEIIALGIPGKEMPKTAARYIKDIIDEAI